MLSIDKLRTGKFLNWAQNETAQQLNFHEPSSIEEISSIVEYVRAEKKTIRTVGAAHSFSPVAKPQHHSMSLHQLRGLISIDKEHRQATFWAGTYLHEIGPVLKQYGLALENMGDIAEQSIAGAISTGTHGTGLQLRSISNQVVKWGFIDGTGQYREVTRQENDGMSQALHLSLGLLGVIVQVTFQALPLYALSYTSQHCTIEETLKNASTIMGEHRHAEWFYFPGQEKMQLKTMDQLESPTIQTSRFQKWTDDFMENNVLQLLSTGCKIFPKASHLVSKVSARGVPTGTKEEYCYDIFPSPRKVKFLEMEYAVPIAYFEAVLEEIHFVLKSKPFHVHFPIEIRVAAGESGFLSPTQGADSAFFAFHMYKGMPHEAYFTWAHRLLEKYQARPHLGKMNQLTYETMQAKYAQLHDFLAIREQLDPQNVFVTNYFNELLKIK
ncbi:MAG: FAD-binding protein [Kurthia sp.]|nr:FAD-binding protein [Candidatus Kurthia equi]